MSYDRHHQVLSSMNGPQRVTQKSLQLQGQYKVLNVALWRRRNNAIFLRSSPGPMVPNRGYIG